MRFESIGPRKYIASVIGPCSPYVVFDFWVPKGFWDLRARSFQGVNLVYWLGPVMKRFRTAFMNVVGAGNPSEE